MMPVTPDPRAPVVNLCSLTAQTKLTIVTKYCSLIELMKSLGYEVICASKVLLFPVDCV